MGTRGFIGFVIDGEEKITYNHFDSYPNGLGMEVLTWFRDILQSSVSYKSYIRNLKMVDGKSEPTEAQIKELRPYADLNVSQQSLKDWYCLLRRTQGDPGAILAAGYAIDSSDFPMDSLMCEWGYIIDTDTETFEVYEGFQKEPHNRGRFAHRPPVDLERHIKIFGHGYYPVALRAAWSFNAIPTGEEFLAILIDLPEEED